MVSAAVFAVQMAVDGVALKAAIDAWEAASSTADATAAYRVAESVRSVEKGLSALFNLVNGLTLLSLGVGLTLGGGRGRRLGWIAAVAGVGFVAVGFLTARTGFSHEATSAALPATVTLVVFAVGMAFAGWRGTRQLRRPGRAPSALRPRPPRAWAHLSPGVWRLGRLRRAASSTSRSP